MKNIKETKNTKNEIGTNIKRFRLERNLSQEAFADKVYSTKSTISKWEKGDIVPSIEMTKIIAKSLDVSLYQILGEKQPLSNKVFNYIGKALIWMFAWVHLDITFTFTVMGVAITMMLAGIFSGVGGFGAQLTDMIIDDNFGSMKVAILIGYLVWIPLFLVVFGAVAIGLYIIARQAFAFSLKFFWKNKRVKFELKELTFLNKFLKNKKSLIISSIILAVSFIYFIVVVSIEGTSNSHWQDFRMDF